MSCGYVRPETHQEMCIRQYKMAKKVVESLLEQGKLKDLCRDSAIQIPLFKNIIVRIYNNQEIQVYYGNQKKKPQKGEIPVKI